MGAIIECLLVYSSNGCAYWANNGPRDVWQCKMFVDDAVLMNKSSGVLRYSNKLKHSNKCVLDKEKKKENERKRDVENINTQYSLN